MASTMRASMSTSGVWVSSERMSSSIWFRLPATSRTMRMLVRSSTETEPRGESMSFALSWRCFASAYETGTSRVSSGASWSSGFAAGDGEARAPC